MVYSSHDKQRSRESLNDQRWLQNLTRFGLPAIILVFYVTAATHFSYTPDDTYIYLQFAKNIVHGNGFAFNAGEPTYGITSPLWLFIISSGGWLSIDLYVVAKVFDLVLASFALLVLYVFAFEVIHDHWAALCATLSFSVNIWFLRWAGTGMETSFSILLLLLTIRYYLRNEYHLAVIFAGFLTLTRPEAWLLTLLMLIGVYLSSSDKRRARKMIAALVIIYAALLAPWLIYAYSTFGTIVPNTALAKAGMGFHLDDFTWTFTDIAKTLAVSDGITIAVVLIGVFALARQGQSILVSPGLTGNPKEETPISNARWLESHFLPLAWLVGLPLLYVFTNANVISRYLLLVVPIIVVYAFAVLWRALAMWRRENLRFVLGLGLTAILMGQNQFVFYSQVKPSIAAFTQGMQDCFIPIGKWFKANTPEDAVIFAPDIGALGYYSDRKICDAAGLISPEFLRFLRNGYTLDRMVEERMYRTVCEASYAVHRSHAPDEVRSAELTPLFWKPVFGLGLSDMRTVYYTVYEVNNLSSGE